jgi:hypothetical protein
LISKPAGSNANFTDANSVTTTFIADIADNYVVSLTVNDGQVSSSASTVTITAIAANNPPIANAGPDQLGKPSRYLAAPAKTPMSQAATALH